MERRNNTSFGDSKLSGKGKREEFLASVLPNTLLFLAIIEVVKLLCPPVSSFLYCYNVLICLQSCLQKSCSIGY